MLRLLVDIKFASVESYSHFCELLILNTIRSNINHVDGAFQRISRKNTFFFAEEETSMEVEKFSRDIKKASRLFTLATINSAFN